MAHEDKVAQLVFTIRDLNQQVRPKATTTIGGAEGEDKQIHSVLTTWRESEHLTSRTLKLMTLGEAGIAGADDVVIGDPEKMSSRMLMSEISTAREAILATIRDLSSAQWDEFYETVEGSKTVTELVDELIEQDKNYLGQLGLVTTESA